jgi:hypothetical protein
MPDVETFTGAYGFNLVIDTNLDLTDATALKLKIKSPTGTTVSRDLTGSNVTDPVKGIVTYQVANNDFTVPGLFKVQVNDETGGTKKVISNILKIRVRASLEYIGG